MRGGFREGAGRKPGVPNFLTQELREKINAEKLIFFLHDLVDGKIEGTSVHERKETALSLLKKVLPDINVEYCEETVPLELMPYSTSDDDEDN